MWVLLQQWLIGLGLFDRGCYCWLCWCYCLDGLDDDGLFQLDVITNSGRGRGRVKGGIVLFASSNIECKLLGDGRVAHLELIDARSSLIACQLGTPIQTR